MDPTKFDTFTKAMATSTSRRHALKKIAVTALGGLLGLGGIGTVFARKPCKDNGDHCSFDHQCCSGACCHGTCTNLSNNHNNCGKCGHACAPDQVCQHGSCVTLTTTTTGTTSTTSTTGTTTGTTTPTTTTTGTTTSTTIPPTTIPPTTVPPTTTAPTRGFRR